MRHRIFALLIASLALSPFACAADVVHLGQATTSLAFLPVWAARALDTFKPDGISLDWAAIPGGDPSTLAALDGGDIDLAAVGSDTALAAIAKGQPFQIVGTLMDRVSLDLVVSNAFLQRSGVSPSDPLDKRIAALKGAVVGVSAVGGAQDRAVRWLAAHGGGDPKSLQVAMVGGPPALQAALANGRIDAFILSPPEAQIAEAAGAGKRLVSLSQDFPDLRAVPFLVLVAKTPIVDPARLIRTLHALAAADADVLDRPAETADAIQRQFFPKIAPAIIRAGLDALHDGVAAKGALDALRAAAMLRFAQEAGIDVHGLDKMQYWTSTFVEKAVP
jgi:ABC-type nitrate/sulfonate/bicarbonate transport system substrate-binding protein